jgi:glycosyltransferase involved in cell wall biosynthesis
MRILHIITSLRTGGAEHLLVDLLPRLKTYGHEVELLVFDGTPTPFFDQLSDSGINIHVLGIGYAEMYNPMNYYKLRSFFSHHTYDIVHTHNTPCQLLVAMLQSKITSRLVTTEHSTTNSRRKWLWFRHFDKMMYSQYSSVICVSNRVRINLIDSLKDEKLNNRICLIYNGVQMEVYRPTLATADDNKKNIIMVAGFRAPKDHPTLIRAISVLPKDYHLVLVGDGPCRKSCEELAKSLDVTDRITFTGVRTDIPQLLAESDVAVLSSHYEGLPLTAIEAMAAGKPLLASDVDGVHDVVAGAGLLFQHQDYRKLAELIEKVCTDKDFRNDIIDKCRKRAECYDISKTVKEYNELYLRL